ncbi:MAG: DoxX family membrane protein [Bdellovibrio sp.]|jgi:thiosulfate dehydrogenase [quinone] large subunit
MFAAFFESVKYVGHLVPLSFLRVFLGYTYLQAALLKFNSDYLIRPRLAGEIAEILPALQAPLWYKNVIDSVFIPHWQTFAFVVVGLEFAIAISYLLGYVVRPIAILAALMALNQLVLAGPGNDELARLLMATHLLLAWIGAGRCLGFDYYFFKRRRGIWW